MSKVTYDSKRNAVIIHFAGDIDVPHLEEVDRELRKIVPTDHKGFRLLTDLTDVRSVGTGAHEPVKQMMDYLNARGVREIFRVIPDPDHDIGLGIMSIFHYSKDVRIVTLQSLQEALERLDNE